MFGQSLLSAFGIACTTDTDQLFTTPTSTTSLATYQLNNATTSIPSNTYPGTASNITYAAGKFGNAAVFNGSNSEIVASSSITPSSGGFAISWWQKTTQADNTYSYTMDNGGGSLGNGLYIITHRTDVGLIIGFKNASTFGSASIPYSSAERTQWTHFCFSWDGTTTTNAFKIYKNNIATSFTSTVTNAGAAYPFRIGRSYNGTDYFGGSIDQVRIFNTALPQAAVTALYNETTTTATSASIDYQVANPNSVAYYKMSDATDQLGNYNGTATNVNFNTEGKFGFAGAFNGSNSRFQLNLNPNAALFSASFWINLNDVTGNTNNILGNLTATAYALGFTLYVYLGKFNVVTSSNTVNWDMAKTYNQTINNNQWYHVAFVSNGSNNDLYINGQIVSSTTIFIGSQVSLNSNSSNLEMSFGGSTRIINGKVDQVRIYDSAISAADVTTLYKEVECEAAAINALDQFNTVLYTGNGGTQSITGLNFSPDLVWMKNRGTTQWHGLYDSIRGASKWITSNGTNAEADTSGTTLTSFDSNGFSLGNDSNGYGANTSGNNYVSWNWKAPLANLSTSFNGSSSQITLLDSLGTAMGNNNFSVSFWVNVNSASQSAIYLSITRPYDFYVATFSGVIYLNLGTLSYSTGISLSTGWHHIAVTKSSSSGSILYLDNNATADASKTGNITANNIANSIGNYNNGSYIVDGEMGQVRIFDDVLTASEVADLYTEPAASNNTLNYPAGAGCIAAYPLQTDAVDLSGNYSGASSNVTFGQPGYLTGNTDGTIPSTVAVNDAAGFSIVKYQANSTQGATIGHGLSSAPEMIITKEITGPRVWCVYHKDLTNSGYYLELNTSDAEKNALNTAYAAVPSSTTYSVGTSSLVNDPSTDSYIAYCFKSIPGYSKIGSYVGTGSNNNFQYTGFEPAWILIKNTSGTGSWWMLDNKRSPSNPRNERLVADQSYSEVEYTPANLNFLSNGFGLDGSYAGTNSSGQTYIFLAIA